MRWIIAVFVILTGTLAIVVKRPHYEIKIYQDEDYPMEFIFFGYDTKIALNFSIAVGTRLGPPILLENNSFLFSNGYILSNTLDHENGLFTNEWIIPNEDPNTHLKDCFTHGDNQIYGGTELYTQLWPTEQIEYTYFSWVTKENNNSALMEPFWLFSHGHYVYVDQSTPLFVSQNDYNPNRTCLSARIMDPYKRRDKLTFKYYIYIGTDLKKSHAHAVANFLQKPSGHPNPKMFAEPIWSTWVKYKRDINQSTVLSFAQEIKAHGYKGQIEIDDSWETCYGSLEFNRQKFPNVTELVQNLKNMGFRVTLWVHPFINLDCKDTLNEALSSGFLVRNLKGKVATQWWNSDQGQATYIDFSKEEAKNWWVDRLLRLKNETGIDGFKCDAGESSWLPQLPRLNVSEDEYPSIISDQYVSACSLFGDVTEVRTGHRSQKLPIFFRMIDKDSKWGYDNGLKSVITTTLQLNTIGYPFILPDMVGGNAYEDDVVTKELFIRWLQVNTFLPSIQFSVLPWDFDEETDNITQKFVQLHEQYTPLILENANRSVELGTPLNPPVCWSDSLDPNTYTINDQYMLGEDILVAPVVEKGETSRDIYLPQGNWLDGNTNETIEGQKWLRNYPAPLDVLPYFIKQ